MSSPPETPADSPGLAELLERCSSLCRSIDASAGHSPSEADDFLTSNLADTLQQLELLLHVLNRESQEAASASTPVEGFLERFFRRADSAAAEAERDAGEADGGADAALSSFDVAKRGLQGSSWTIPISELMSFLASQRKTGILWVDSIEEDFVIGFEDGQLIHASGSRTPEGSRLGETLVGIGCLTRRQLDRFLAVHYDDPSQVFGEMLLSRGIISAEELGAALIQQFQQTFQRLVHTKNAVFRFREGLEVALEFKVQLGINQLLLDSARVTDEAGNPDLHDAALVDKWNEWKAGITERVISSSEPEPDSDLDDEPEDAGEDAPGPDSDEFLGVSVVSPPAAEPESEAPESGDTGQDAESLADDDRVNAEQAPPPPESDS